MAKMKDTIKAKTDVAIPVPGLGATAGVTGKRVARSSIADVTNRGKSENRIALIMRSCIVFVSAAYAFSRTQRETGLFAHIRSAATLGVGNLLTKRSDKSISRFASVLRSSFSFT
jgi:hypothetical protein